MIDPATLAALNADLPEATRTFGGKIVDGNLDEGWLEMHWDMPERFCHGLGLQGGLVAGMLDDTMARMLLVCSRGTMLPPTLDLNVSYLLPGAAGFNKSIARLVRQNQSIAYAEASLWSAREKLVAKASATLLVRDIRFAGLRS